MGPLTKLAAICLAGLMGLLCLLGVRSCYRVVFRPAATPAAPSAPISAPSVEADAREWADPIAALSALTDFQKLSTLSSQSRAINPRVKKILYWLYAAEQKGIEPGQAIDKAFAANGNAGSRKAVEAKAQTLVNYRTAKLWGLFTLESLPKLRRGEEVQLTRGTYVGQFIEIDHIVPLARYPEFANDLANLQLLPQSQNRTKSDRMGAVEYAKLKELQGSR